MDPIGFGNKPMLGTTRFCLHDVPDTKKAGGVGCSIETLAELMGDTPKVAFDHFGKERGQHYQDPLWAAMGMPSQKEAKKR
jgi:hypothetical protein